MVEALALGARGSQFESEQGHHYFMPYLKDINTIDWAKEGYDMSIMTQYAPKAINMSYYTRLISRLTLETPEQKLLRLLRENDLSS